MLMNLPTTTTFDSAGLAGLASIAHPLREPGHWRLETYVLRAAASRIADIVVRDGGKARAVVDLSGSAANGGYCAEGDQLLSPNGMINLFAQNMPRGGYALLYRGSGDKPIWDSRVLVPGDHYACMPLRPGRYLVTNLLGSARASVQVNYPDPRKTAQGLRLATGPVQLTVGPSIAPSELRIDPGQLLIFAIETKAHLAVTLEEPDDGPAELVEWRVQRSRQALEAAFARQGASSS